ncbi:UNVERIFIED_CONTAM: hypothetical protein Sradi_0218300 [Sesamum radiatum]|uniref:Uncharacterized protein n=1 Tax=Sesamum radiatum TaxID=300843 RepID=A0AAW2W1I3_SESRA
MPPSLHHKTTLHAAAPAADASESEVPAVIYTEGMKLVATAAERAIFLSESAAGERINLNLLSYSVLSQSPATK